MYSRMNCLIENAYIKGTFQKKIISYVFTNELPNWKRLHKGNLPKKKSAMYSRMNCLIENAYIKGTYQKKISYVFTNELPNWKRILKGKNGKKRGKQVGVLYYGGVY